MAKKICFLLALSLSYFSWAQQIKSALFLGNSYTYVNNLPAMIGSLANSMGNEFVHTSSTQGGAPLVYHSSRPDAPMKIDNESYDYLILQEQSTRLAASENGFTKYFHLSYYAADFLDHRSKLADTCHKTLLYQTWGRKEGHSIYQPSGYYGSNYEEMQNNLSTAYSQLAELIDAEIAPVGEVWRKSLALHPEIELYSADGSHPSVAGTYLAACTFYTAIFQEELNNAWKPNGVKIVSAKKIQTLANNLVAKSLEDWNINVNLEECKGSGLMVNNDEWDSLGSLDYRGIDQIRFINDKQGYISGDLIWKTHNGGVDWSEIEAPVTSLFNWRGDDKRYDIFFLNPDTAWFAIGAGDIDSATLDFLGLIEGYKANFDSYVRFFRSIDGGKSWEERSPNRLDHIRLDSGLIRNRPTFVNPRIQFDNELNGVVLCNYDGDDTTAYSFKTIDGGQTWSCEKTTIGRSSGNIWFRDADYAYKSGLKDSASLAEAPQVLFKTENGGISWEKAGEMPNSCCDFPFRNVVHHISAFQEIGQDTLVAVSSLFSPVFYQSIDAGKNWDTLSVIKSIGEISDFAVIEEGIYMVVTEGYPARVMVSSDYGLSWKEEAHFPYNLRSLSVTENFVYIAGVQGHIYKKNKSLFMKTPELPKNRNSAFRIFPNPSTGQIKIENTTPNTLISLHSLQGALIKTYRANSEGELTMEVGYLASGIYLVQASYNDGIVSRKIILQ